MPSLTMLPSVFERERAQYMSEVTTQKETADDDNYELRCLQCFARKGANSVIEKQ